ncbi:MAG: thioredoxin fold domain-containing protein [Betaproteobacteria bacterium]|nr:thioredoxin fold domain-containing protein [Betaproteobacteria bacterium]
MLAFAAAGLAAPSTALPLATDLRADARLSRARKEPIVILFSLPGCPYCEIVRRSHLAPMHRDPRESGRAIIRQIDIDSDVALVGFAGERTTHARVARAHDVRAAPVVAFLDGEGRAAADPLSGMLLPDFYSAYLDAALESARARLAARS